MTPVLFATSNPGKFQEAKKILDLLPLKFLSLNDLNQAAFKQLNVQENGSTFIQNAIIKAKAYGQASNLITLADDSGLEVDALRGKPGVYSHRYGPTTQQRNQKLLQELGEIADSQRTARFVSAVAIYHPVTGKTITTTGTVKGKITLKPLGHNGFGYDPIFYSFDLKKTFAQATSQEKNQVSHRSRALKKALLLLKPLL